MTEKWASDRQIFVDDFSSLWITER